MTVSRRDVLKALAVPCLAGLGAAGCGAGNQTVRVAVVWSGWELSQFIKVMNAFSERYGFGYSIESMGDDTIAFLSNEVTADSQPDVALVPQPGLVRSSVARLSPVGWPQPDALAWQTLLTDPGLRQYGVWFKAAYESMVWHRDDLPAPPGGWTWDSWVGQCRALAWQGRAPLAIGAADGWVLAGWFAVVQDLKQDQQNSELGYIVGRQLDGTSAGARRLLGVLAQAPVAELPQAAVAAMADASLDRTGEHLAELSSRSLVQWSRPSRCRITPEARQLAAPRSAKAAARGGDPAGQVLRGARGRSRRGAGPGPEPGGAAAGTGLVPHRGRHAAGHAQHGHPGPPGRAPPVADRGGAGRLVRLRKPAG